MTTTSLIASLAVPMALLAGKADDTPVRVKLSDDVFVSGDHARVDVKTAKDGYLVVLRVDTEGHVRVIFPVDPGAPDAVKGGHDIEIKSRGGRDAFTVSEKNGGGLVLAARSDTPFNFTPFMTGQHWNFEALVPAEANGDPEAAMVSLVDRMGDGHYDYDAVPYKVENGMGGMRRPGYGYAMYDPYYSPFYYRPVFGGYYSSWPWLYGPGLRTSIVIPIHAFHGRRH